jgi:serine O-acetyltransferase
MYWIAYIVISIVICGSQIPAKCTIGPGLRIPHPFGIFFTREVVIGENALVLQQVTLGSGGFQEGSPVLGNNVVVGSGAKIIGRVRIGSNSTIGANAVILSDVPEHTTVVSVVSVHTHELDESHELLLRT